MALISLRGRDYRHATQFPYSLPDVKWIGLIWIRQTASAYVTPRQRRMLPVHVVNLMAVPGLEVRYDRVRWGEVNGSAEFFTL